MRKIIAILLLSSVFSTTIFTQTTKEEVRSVKSKELKTTFVDSPDNTQVIGDKVSIKDGTTVLIEIENEGIAGSIFLPSVESSLNGPKLYNNAGTLFWGANQLGTASSAAGWTDAGIVIYNSNLTDKVGIGTTDPHALLSVGESGSGNTIISGVAPPGSGVGRAISGHVYDDRGTGVSGSANGYKGIGVNGSALGIEGIGVNGAGNGSDGIGVKGTSTNIDGTGVYGSSNGGNGRGVYGFSLGNLGSGGYFQAIGDEGRGVYGYASKIGNVTNYGGYFEVLGNYGRAVYGVATSPGLLSNAENYGGFFESFGNIGYGAFGRAHGSQGRGVYGFSDGALGYGVIGYGASSGSSTNYGVAGYAFGGSGRGIYGYAKSTGYAGYFSGNVNVTGTLSKGSGSFKIDHPLDPENKYLYHSFVESPDMMNIYNGNVELDLKGESVVQMPDWFESLNKAFRYQLTPIGAPGPNLYIAEEINGNQFKIAGGTPEMKVSWLVTGIRDDAFANENRIKVEELKNEEEKGKYLHPTAFNMPKAAGIEYDDKMELERVRIEKDTNNK